MTDRETAKKVLEEILASPIDDALPLLKKFAALPGATARLEDGKYGFVYVPGKRDDRVVLAAHADTVWDKAYTEKRRRGRIKCRDGVYSSGNPFCGIGADDRAGCAILWLLRESGHSLLVTDGEEAGMLGSGYIRSSCPELFAEINSHSYIIQADRRNASDYKCYNLPVTDEFRKFIEENTGYSDAGRNAATDIVALCDKICGVNFSVGYYNEHHKEETLVFDEWYNTFCIIEKMITPPQKRFLLAGS